MQTFKQHALIISAGFGDFQIHFIVKYLIIKCILEWISKLVDRWETFLYPFDKGVQSAEWINKLQYFWENDLVLYFYLNIPASAIASTKLASSIESPESASANLIPSALNLSIASDSVRKFPVDFDIFSELSKRCPLALMACGHLCTNHREVILFLQLLNEYEYLSGSFGQMATWLYKK